MRRILLAILLASSSCTFPVPAGGQQAAVSTRVDFVAVMESVARISGTEYARESGTYVVRRAK